MPNMLEIINAIFLPYISAKYPLGISSATIMMAKIDCKSIIWVKLKPLACQNSTATGNTKKVHAMTDAHTISRCFVEVLSFLTFTRIFSHLILWLSSRGFLKKRSSVLAPTYFTIIVSSAWVGLTAVFEMGTGVPQPL